MGRRRTTRRQPVPGVTFERGHWEAGRLVAGVDEVGRGAWAGPVTVGAVVLPTDRRVYKLRDSKMLLPEERERLAARLRTAGAAIGIGHATNAEIDRIGMSAAMRLAARRAVDELPDRPEALLLDGNWDFLDGYGTANQLLVRGDARCASIAAASIVAKVARDGLMRAAAPDHPGYDFASNKGYPAPLHRAGLATHGPCELHRRSWAPIVALTHPRLFSGDQVDGAQTDGDRVDGGRGDGRRADGDRGDGDQAASSTSSVPSSSVPPSWVPSSAGSPSS